MKAAIYIRVSTRMQADKESLPIQRKEVTRYVKNVLGIDAYEVFEDAGFSGKDIERPAYRRMMEKVRAGELSHLAVWKLDRISRNLVDFAKMYDEMKALGVAFVSQGEQFDTSSAIGEAMLKIILVFAELERKATSERVRAVMISRATDGKWNGGNAPAGYIYKPETKTFEVDQPEAEKIRLIFDIYERKHSVRAVTKLLETENIKSKNGNSFSDTTISKILFNPFYAGCIRYDAHFRTKTLRRLKDSAEWILAEGNHAPIISLERWGKVYKRLVGKE